MRRTLLSRFLVAAIVLSLVGPVASDVFAQTNQLDKTLVRKFPEGYCPIDTELMGSFVTFTGHIRLGVATTNGWDDNGTFQFFQQKLDNVVVLEASVFDANKIEHENCYFDGPPFVQYLNPAFQPEGAPGVVFFDTFSPSTSECPWDETDGATVDTGEGNLKIGNVALGEVPVGTSVIISGLTPNVPYVLCADWSAFAFNLPSDCEPDRICFRVTVDDLPKGCEPVPARTSTWGAVKSLFDN